MVFKTTDNSRHLRLSFLEGTVDYEATMDYSHAYLVKDVPNEKQAVNLTKKILPELCISLSDLDKKENANKPGISSGVSQVTYFVNHQAITNTFSRGVSFRRAVDGFSFISVGTGGDGDIRFGDHGKIAKIDLSWRNMERTKSYPTLSPEMMIKSLRDGKAVQGYLSMNSRGIDWRTAKIVTVNQARPCYYAGDSLRQHSDWLEPFACLDTVVDTGHGNIRVEIDCPIIDE